MHSKWMAWDFFKTQDSLLKGTSTGIYTFSFFDPFIAKFGKDLIKKNTGDLSFQVLVGKEVTLEWLENNVSGLSLFGGQDIFFIQHAEDLSKDIVEFLLQENLDFSSNLFVFFFHKETPLRTKLIKMQRGDHHTISAPPFWENGKLLDFLCDRFSLNLKYEAKNYLLSALENNCEQFVYALNILSLNYSDQVELSIKDVQALIRPSKLDTFELAKFFSIKNTRGFYTQLCRLKADFDDLRSFFSFMQGHLAKILDPSYAAKKTKLSKYDKEILDYQKNWNKEDLLCSMREFGEFEILAKRKSDHLQDQLRLKSIGELF